MTKTNKEIAKKKMINLLQSLTLEKLIETWEGVDEMKMSPEVAIMREHIFNEMEKRNKDAVDEWFDAEYDQGKNLSPREFFIK